MSTPLLFKKYANRRLYNTETSAYVTLSQLGDLIRSGREVSVIDAKTLEDVTAFTLTQIILEESKKNNTLLPSPLLHLIIRYGDNLLMEFFDKYLEQTVQNYLAYKTALDEQFKSWIELGMNISDMAPKTMADIKAFETFLNMFPNLKRNSK